MCGGVERVRRRASKSFAFDEDDGAVGDAEGLAEVVVGEEDGFAGVVEGGEDLPRSRFAAEGASRPAKGSSARRRSGLCMRARAMETRWAMPRLKDLTGSVNAAGRETEEVEEVAEHGKRAWSGDVVEFAEEFEVFRGR